MKLLSRLFFVNIILLISGLNTYPQVYKVIESGADHIIVEFNFGSSYPVVDTTVEGRTYQKIRGEDYSMRNPGDPWVPEFMVLAGIPFDSKPNIKIIEQRQSVIKNKFIIPYPEEDPAFVKQDFEKINREIYSKNELFPASPANFNEIYVVRYANILPITIAPYQFNPVTRDLVFNSYVKIRVDFNDQNRSNIQSLNDVTTDDFLKSSTINYQEAQSFTGIISSGDSPLQQNNYWYNPNKDYFKIYVKNKNVYRITYQELVSAGAQFGESTSIKKLEIFNEGLPVPIEVFDNNKDSVFNAGDYFQFVGYPPKATPYCKTNIYNLTNVYWFSYQSDSSGVNYVLTPSFVSDFTRSYFTNLTTLHFEKDSLYENLGYADERRDFWLWDRASSRNGEVAKAFGLYFDSFPLWYTDSTTIRLRIAMQGLSNSGICSTDHKAYVIVNNRAIGDISWDGQNDVIFNKTFHASPDSIPIFPGNDLLVEVRGDVCNDIDDEIRVNWVEFEYWRANSVLGKYFSFINSDPSGINRYPIFDWQGSDMRIYMPSKNKMMYIPNTSNFEQFTDTMNTKTEYFLVSSDYSTSVDSLVADVSSDLRNPSNSADYIIITHHKFKDIANQLAALRSTNFPDENIPNPRIKIVYVEEIYDEFSFGLLEPSSVRDFVKYAFENWELPAPLYIVLLGDMSHDYRGLLASNRPNFVPSIPFFSYTYGLAASDNLIVCVAGNDAAPDLTIGRLSIETVVEGNILLQKLTDYPDDPTKNWKQNVLLLASGLSLQDEIQFGFNDASLFLGNTYVKPNGYVPTYVFRYPSKPEHEPYQGEGPKIREEISKGAVLVNYYGHGGGYQWDLVFTNDDIYLLENEGRLPLILSVTCYTAHFENQDVFGEQFNKVNGKGSIGFYGSAGLTYWGIGTHINRELFDEVFNLRNFISGKAFMNSKNRVPSTGLYAIQLNMLTYLGDPVFKLALPNHPDFVLKSNEIKVIPESPLVGDSVQVKIGITNVGAIFPNDSVVVELYAELQDTAYQIGLVKRGSFGERDSVYFPWVPDKGGLYRLIAKVNETDIIIEEDHSDNIGTAQVIIFNISEPNILAPIDGFVSTSSQVEFDLAEIGYYLPKELSYFVRIDTSLSITAPPLLTSGELISNKSIVKWNSPNLPSGVYFWRARIFDGTDYGNWSPVRSFSIMNQSRDGYYAHEDILKTFSTYNINYSELNKSLVLNTDPLPAKPNNKTREGDFLPDPQLPDSLKLTTIATDGTYLYFANIWFYARELTDGKSLIYRVGTGNNGTVEGQFYGTFSAFHDTVLHSIVCHSDGYLYVAIGKANKLVRINTATEGIDTITIPVGILNNDNATITDGPQFLTSDGTYIYNIAKRDSLGNRKYTLRTFDPSTNWSLPKADISLFGTSYDDGFTGFFVHGDRVYTCDYYNNYMRRHRMSDGFFEEEWLVSEPMPANFKHYFAWCQDWQHDKIYASIFKYADTTVVAKFAKFAGYYVDANGTITTKQVGPVAWWNNLKYDLINPSQTGVYSTTLFGQNSSTKNWDTLQVNISDSTSLSEVNANLYTNLRLKFDLTDSTFTTTEPMELRSVQFDYQPLSDIYVEREDFNFHQDSLLQGYPVTFDFKARNFGGVTADSLKLNFYLNGLDSLIYSPIVRVPGDSSSIPVEYTVDTRKLLFENEISVFGEQRKREYFYFNNLTDQNFFVARDSIRPVFNVKFDGQEIIDNDIVSATPEVIMSLEDNSPLPLDTTLFTIVHNNKPLKFFQPELSYNYGGPGTPFVITWKPQLIDGRHTLEILAKDKSGNFFDSTSYRIIFYVFNENDITDIYNYPNPFARTTHFTFLLKGQDKPDELDIKIYTIAGRLIRNIKLSPTDLITNFNKIYWDGRDEDGDEVGNGVYLYKVIAKFPDKTRTVTQKLAKVR